MRPPLPRGVWQNGSGATGAEKIFGLFSHFCLQNALGLAKVTLGTPPPRGGCQRGGVFFLKVSEWLFESGKWLTPLGVLKRAMVGIQISSRPRSGFGSWVQTLNSESADLPELPSNELPAFLTLCLRRFFFISLSDSDSDASLRSGLARCRRFCVALCT